MEVSNGEITGTYYAYKTPELMIPLFYSKTIADKMLGTLSDADRFEVRGVSQFQLKGFIAQMKEFGVFAAIYCLPYWVADVTDVPFVSISAEQLEKEYIY